MELVNFAKQNAFELSVLAGGVYLGLGRLKNLQEGQGCPKYDGHMATAKPVFKSKKAEEVYQLKYLSPEQMVTSTIVQVEYATQTPF